MSATILVRLVLENDLSNQTLQSDRESFRTNPQQRLHPLNGTDALKTSRMVNFKQPSHVEKVIQRTLKLITKARNKSKDSHQPGISGIAGVHRSKLIHSMLCKICYKFPECA